MTHQHVKLSERGKAIVGNKKLATKIIAAIKANRTGMWSENGIVVDGIRIISATTKKC